MGAEKPSSEGGFTLIEITVAMAILSVVAVGFAASIAVGLKGVAIARQRQVATDVASARLEHLRNVEYDEIALSSNPVHSPDESNPDYYVTGTNYDVTGTGTLENLIVDTTNGNVLHIEDPVIIGNTSLEIYQYATWVDDAAISGSQDYKRVTVVVRYKNITAPTRSQIVRMSTLFVTGGIAVAGSTTAPSGTTSSTSSTTTIPSSGCSGDTTGPTGSFTLAGSSGAASGFTASATVSATFSLSDSCSPVEYRLSNDNATFSAWTTFDSLNPLASWALSSGEGTKTVYAQARDGVGNITVLSERTVILDTTLPTTPGTLNRTVSCSGSTRNVTLTWSASSDTNLLGYRLYRSTDGSTWSILATTTSLSRSDSHSKGLQTVRYKAVGYDSAGNESNATNIVSLAKNQCS